MKYYHGSKKGDLKELVTSHNEDELIYVTNSRLVALTYAVRGYPNLFTTLKSGQEAFLEVVPGLFEKMFKGKTAYIYILEEKNYNEVNQSNKCGHSNCFSINENVRIIDKEYIKDAYQEFLKYIEREEFKIVKSKDIPDREHLVEMIIRKAPEIDLSNKDNYLHLIKNK